MWDRALRVSTQRVTDALLHRPVLSADALAFEKVSGAIAVRTALRLVRGEQSLIFAVPQASSSTTRHLAAALLIGDYAHGHAGDELPAAEGRRLLKGDLLVVTHAISESKAQLDELVLPRGHRLRDIWEVTPLTKYTAQRSDKPRVFLANPGWLAKTTPGRRFGAVLIDGSYPRTFEQLPELFKVACGCSSLRIAVTPPPSEAMLAACGVPSKTSVWLWDPVARQDAQGAVERDDPVPHRSADRFLWVCDDDAEASAVLETLHRRLLEAARAANGSPYPGLKECWRIYNRLRHITVPLAQLEEIAATTWAGNIRGLVKELDSISGHGSVSWDTTWPELLSATKVAYETLLKRNESSKFWALAANLQEFIASPTPHLRIVVGSEAEVTLLLPALENVVDGFAAAVAQGRIELVTGSKEARLVADGQVCPTVLLAPRTNGHRYLDVFTSARVDEFLYPHEVDAERSTQARLHLSWEALQADEKRVQLLEPLGFRPPAGVTPQLRGCRPALVVRHPQGHAVTLTTQAEVVNGIDLDALASTPGSEQHDAHAFRGPPGVDCVTEVRFSRGETCVYYPNERVDVFFTETDSLQRVAPSNLLAGWKVITFVDGHYDSLFQRLRDAVHKRLSPQHRIALELWMTQKAHLSARFDDKRELFNRLLSHGAAVNFGTFCSWVDDGEGGVIAPQQFEDFKALASEIEMYARSPTMLESTFAAIRHERGRNRVTGRMLRKFLRAVISGDGYEEALATARSIDAAMVDVLAAVEVLEVQSVRQIARSSNG